MSTINPTNISAANTGRAQQVMGSIQAELESIKGLSAQIAQLVAQLQALQQSRPERPNTQGMSKDDARKAMEKYEGNLRRWEGDVARVSRQLDQVQEKLSKTEKNLQKLQNQDLPQAQREDTRRAQKELDDARKSMEEAAKSLDNSSEDRVDSGSQVVRAEIRAQIVKSEAGESRLSLEVIPPQTQPGASAETVTGRTAPPLAGAGMPPADLP